MSETNLESCGIGECWVVSFCAVISVAWSRQRLQPLPKERQTLHETWLSFKHLGLNLLDAGPPGYGHGHSECSCNQPRPRTSRWSTGKASQHKLQSLKMIRSVPVPCLAVSPCKCRGSGTAHCTLGRKTRRLSTQPCKPLVLKIITGLHLMGRYRDRAFPRCAGQNGWS